MQQYAAVIMWPDSVRIFGPFADAKSAANFLAGKVIELHEREDRLYDFASIAPLETTENENADQNRQQ